MLKALRYLLIGFVFASVVGRAEPSAGSATFYKDVLPILQRHCQSCHRPGEIGPMPLLTYEQTRPWAKAIRQSVSLRKMPPWFADPHFGKFLNDPSLTAAEIATVGAWVDSGSAAGLQSDAPAPARWPEGGALSGPDLVTGMPRPFPIRARSTIDYQYVILRAEFPADTWVSAVEIRPSNRTVVHHAVLYVREPGSKWMGKLRPGVIYGVDSPEVLATSRDTTADILAIYTPGAPLMSCPEGMARKIPAGSDLILQMHYTAGPADTKDQTAIRMRTSPDAPRARLLTLQMANYDLRVLPGERGQRFSVSGTLPHDALLVSLFPHMHLRGKGFEYQVVEGQGRVDTLLKVDSYDFYWQLSYRLKTPLKLAAGTRLLWTGTFDNSPQNPRNPDPAAEVTWGVQSREEMMVGFFDVAVPPDMDKQAFFIRESAR